MDEYINNTASVFLANLPVLLKKTATNLVHGPVSVFFRRPSCSDGENTAPNPLACGGETFVAGIHILDDETAFWPRVNLCSVWAKGDSPGWPCPSAEAAGVGTHENAAGSGST